MELREFMRSYHETTAALQQTHVAALAASIVLRDFPNRLPEPTRVRVVDLMRQLANALKEATDALRGKDRAEDTGLLREDRINVDSTAGEPEEHDQILSRALMLMVTSGATGIALDRIDFVPLLFAQDIVTTLAHLDGFTADVLKSICVREPRLLRRRKTMTWDSILDAGSWDAVLAQMVEEHAFEFGWRNLTERLKQLAEDGGLSLDMGATELELLESAYQLRHIIVHSGSRVTREFLLRTHRTDVSIGQKLTVTADFAGQINHAAVMMCGDLFVSAAVKFFGASEQELAGVWRRTSRERQPETDVV
jgi:hypothetical protein